MPQEQTPQIAYENDSSHKPTILTAILPSPATIYVDNLAKGSRRAMRQALERVAGVLVCREAAEPRPGWPHPYGQDRNGNPVADIVSFPWATLRAADTAGLRAELLARYSPAYANKMLSALQGTLREAWQSLDQMSAEDYHRAVAVKNIENESLPAGRELTEAEIAALFDACASDPGPAGTRDAAIIGLLYGCLLRRAEVAALTLNDYDRQTGKLNIRQAKRNKSRLVYVEGGAEAALSDWLELRGGQAGPLFLQINKGGRILSRGLSEQAVYDLLKKRAGQGQVAKATPHDLRRTCIGNLLDHGIDIVTVQNIAGHKDPATTARYDRRPERRKREAARTLNIPYKKGRSK